MPDTRLDRADGMPLDGSQVDFGLALVVAGSQINRIVLSRIAERAGLKVIAEPLDRAASVLSSRRPGTVILESENGGRDCPELIADLAEQRRAHGGRTPFVILLSSEDPPAGTRSRDGTVDAVVAKPVTPDRLQPLIRSLIDRVRD